MGLCYLDEPDTDDSVPDDSLPDDPGFFSFFVTSRVALQDLSGSEFGFGGDLSYGETGPGAGLRGADIICAEISERSMPGASAKQWRAFLSVHAGEDGEQVDAIDRIGDGPWYDRIGRLVAPSPADLLHTRPQNGDAEISDDLPNENGVPNSEVDPGIDTANERNHHILTGSTVDGTLYPARCIKESHGSGLVGECMDSCFETGGESIEYYVCENCELPIEDDEVLGEFCGAACEGVDGYTSDCEAPVNSTCNDWTLSEPDPSQSQPRVGLSWPRDDRTIDQDWNSWWNVGGCCTGWIHRRWAGRGRGGSARLLRRLLLLLRWSPDASCPARLVVGLRPGGHGAARHGVLGGRGPARRRRLPA